MKAKNNFTETELVGFRNVCEAIEKGQIFVIIANKRMKICSRENTNYTCDYTYNFIRFGVGKKARNTDFHIQADPYNPRQYCSALVARFINTAVDMGLYTRTTKEVFNGGKEFQIIFM